jgi:site-specific recombinase XerD|tara:strand:- start:676 stop:1932 length:1257 start_codon:yes stop_codon:yes gene_type:complete
MSPSSTFSILIWINSSRAKNNSAELYARITVNSKRANISLKKKIDINTWDKAKSRVKGNSQEARIINQYIEQTKSSIFQTYQELKSERKLITAQLIKARFLGTDNEKQTIQGVIKYHNEYLAHKLHKDTLRSYKTSQRYILEFIKSKYKTSDVYLENLNYQFIIGFENFLRNYVCKKSLRKIGNNTTIKHIKRLRKMINMAIALEWLNKDPFIKFKAKLEKREREFLTQIELEFIEDYESKISRLDLVKDLFLFSCYTGIAYVDIMELTNKNILKGIDGNLWIETTRVKTKTTVRLPLLEVPETILSKYKTDIRAIAIDKLFPKISNQKLNSYLKEIADLCGIKKNLTFHMARHTFATTVTLTNGVPIESVSKMLGHTKLTTTQIYAKVVESKVSDDMNHLRSILNNKREVNALKIPG